MMRLQTEAAIMTPAAKPRERVSASAVSFSGRKKKTTAAPTVVQRKVKPVQSAVHSRALRRRGSMAIL